MMHDICFKCQETMRDTTPEAKIHVLVCPKCGGTKKIKKIKIPAGKGNSES